MRVGRATVAAEATGWPKVPHSALAGYRAIRNLVDALRAHDAQLGLTEGNLDTAQDAA